MKNVSNHYKIVLERKIRRCLRRTDWILYNIEEKYTPEQVQDTIDYKNKLRLKIKNIDDNTIEFPELPSFINPLDLEE